MIVSVSEDDFKLLSTYVKDKCGIVIPPEKAYLIETRLSRLLVECKVGSFGELYRFMTNSKDSTLQEKVINAITTNETLWFRDKKPWEVLERDILPRLERELLDGKISKARIWCAAVSTGQEAYSTAMCVDNWLKTRRSQISLNEFDIFGTDISTSVLDIAGKGRYDAISIMRGMDPYYRGKYFKQDGNVWVIDENIRNSVSFMKFDLRNSFVPFGKFDAVFCRYVLIYFDDGLKRDIANRLYGALNFNGVVFTGMYVTYQLFQDRFEVAHDGNLTYYIKRANSLTAKGAV